MIQRTVIESHRSSIDQRLAAGVGTLGAQYRPSWRRRARARRRCRSNVQLQRAIADKRHGAVRKLAELASGGGLQITVADGSGKLLTAPRRPGTRPDRADADRRIRQARDRRRPTPTSAYLIAPVGARRHRREARARRRAASCSWATSRCTLPRALALGRPFALKLAGRGYRAAASKVDDSQHAVALYPQRKLDSYTRSIRLRVALLMGLLLLLIGAGAALAVRSLTHTLRTFADGIRAVAAGRFDQRLPVRGDRRVLAVRRGLQRHVEPARAAHRGARLGAPARAGVRAALRRRAGRDARCRRPARDRRRLGGAARARARVRACSSPTRAPTCSSSSCGAASSGAAAGLLDAPVRYGEGIEGRALQTRQAVIGDEPVPLLAAPLVAEERVLGLLTLVGNPDRPFGRDDAERVGSLVGQGAVAIENARLHRLIQKQAKTDPLTQLLNRREFEEQLAREVERAQRFGTPVGLVVLDLDDFKLINDRFGHLAGDGVLKAAAGAIRQCTREIDQPARWGGEEFAVILPHTGHRRRRAPRRASAPGDRRAPDPDAGRPQRARDGVLRRRRAARQRHDAGRAHGRRGRRRVPLQARRQEPRFAGRSPGGG